MAHDVFISYSSQNKSIADLICNSLENCQIRCWYAPRDVRPGYLYAEEICEAIQHAAVFLLLFTEESNRSKAVLQEIDLAMNAECLTIPFKITERPLSGAMQFYLAAVHWIDAVTPPLEKRVNELAGIITSVLRPQLPVQSAAAKAPESETGAMQGGGRDTPPEAAQANASEAPLAATPEPGTAAAPEAEAPAATPEQARESGVPLSPAEVEDGSADTMPDGGDGQQQAVPSGQWVTYAVADDFSMEELMALFLSMLRPLQRHAPKISLGDGSLRMQATVDCQIGEEAKHQKVTLEAQSGAPGVLRLRVTQRKLFGKTALALGAAYLFFPLVTLAGAFGYMAVADFAQNPPADFCGMVHALAARHFQPLGSAPGEPGIAAPGEPAAP